MRALKKWWGRLLKVPHLFGKTIVWWCVIFGTGFCGWSLRILSRTGHDPSGVLAVILAFLGGELLLLCLRKVLSDKK